MWSFELLMIAFAIFVSVGNVFVLGTWILFKRVGTLSALFLFTSALGGMILLDIFIVEPNWIEVKPVPIHDAALATVIGDTRIVQISDLHLTKGLGFRERELIKKINALNADLIFITGDFIDHISQIGPAKELIRRLKANIGIYGVPGNTDHIVLKAPELARQLEPAGIKILINESVDIALRNGKSLKVVGLDDPKYGHDKIGMALRGVPVGVPSVLLAHAPEIFEEAAREGINLVLAGDTHGGQVGIPFLIRLSDYANRSPYISGFYKRKDTTMYVNRGIGMKTLPIRFLCRPEISMIQVTS
jgi:uncharacterized protein